MTHIVLHCCQLQVGQLSGYVAEHSAYHHGDVSLQGTIINLAQEFVGSNNINVLDPNGQFGTRLQVCCLLHFISLRHHFDPNNFDREVKMLLRLDIFLQTSHRSPELSST
jgi:hypothetical protein